MNIETYFTNPLVPQDPPTPTPSAPSTPTPTPAPGSPPPPEAPPSRRAYRPRKNCGRLPTKRYLFLRKHVKLLLALQALGHPDTDKEGGAALGVSERFYNKIRQFMEAHHALLAAADATGNWADVEAIVYRTHSGYRKLSSYQQVLVELGVRPAPPQTPTQAAKPCPLPAATVNEASRARQQIERWIELGMLAEKYLTPEGMAQLLGPRSPAEASNPKLQP